MIPTIRHSRKGKTEDQLLPRAEGEDGIDRWSTENFGGSETTLYEINTAVVDTCHSAFAQAHKRHTTT